MKAASWTWLRKWREAGRVTLAGFIAAMPEEERLTEGALSLIENGLRKPRRRTEAAIRATVEAIEHSREQKDRERQAIEAVVAAAERLAEVRNGTPALVQVGAGK